MSFLDELGNTKTASATTRLSIGGAYWTALFAGSVFLVCGCGLIFAHYTNTAYLIDMTTNAFDVGVCCLLLSVVTFGVGYGVIVQKIRDLLGLLAREKALEYGNTCWSVVEALREYPELVPREVAEFGLTFRKSQLPKSIFGTEAQQDATMAQIQEFKVVKDAYFAAGHKVPK